MRRLKLTLVIAIVHTFVSPCRAELPLNLDEALADISGCTNYLHWMQSVGVVKFLRSIGIFKEAEFFSLQECPEFEPSHCKIVMCTHLYGTEGFSNAVSSIKGIENTLSNEFRHVKMRFNRNMSTTAYHSVCTNIDGCGWTADFFVQCEHDSPAAIQSWKATAEFLKGSSVTNTCEEIGDNLL